MCRFPDAGIETEVNEEKEGFSLPLGIKTEVKEEEGFLWHRNGGELEEGWVLLSSCPQNGGERGGGGVHCPMG